MWDVVEQRITFPDDNKMHTQFLYSENHEQAPPEEELKEITIAGKRALVFPQVVIGPLRPVDDAQGPTRIVASFLRAGAGISEPLTTQLPSRSVIPRDSELGQGEKGYALPFVGQR